MFKFEMNDAGCFRFIKTDTGEVSDWEPYRGVAKLRGPIMHP